MNFDCSKIYKFSIPTHGKVLMKRSYRYSVSCTSETRGGGKAGNACSDDDDLKGKAGRGGEGSSIYSAWCHYGCYGLVKEKGWVG